MSVLSFLEKHYYRQPAKPCEQCHGSGIIGQKQESGQIKSGDCPKCEGEGKLVAGPGPLRPKFFASNTAIQRVKFLMAARKMIKSRPFFGHGIHSWPLLWPRIAAELDQETEGKYLDPAYFPNPVAERTHNDWAEEVVELGIVGFGLCFLIFAMALWNCTEPFLGAALVASLTIALTTYPMRDAAPGLFMWVIAGLICS